MVTLAVDGLVICLICVGVIMYNIVSGLWGLCTVS